MFRGTARSTKTRNKESTIREVVLASTDAHQPFACTQPCAADGECIREFNALLIGPHAYEALVGMTVKRHEHVDVNL